ncbi:MAG: LamG-like jellyroll fold domain-containing protein, partial [Planctomycetota bacterium]
MTGPTVSSSEWKRNLVRLSYLIAISPILSPFGLSPLRADEFSEIVAFSHSFYMQAFTNGPTMVEYLADDLQVPLIRNYSQGGCDIDCLSSRIGVYLASHTPNEATLLMPYSIGYRSMYYDRVDPAVSAADMAALISTLADAGGTYFVLPNSLPGGFFPFMQADFPGEEEVLNQISAQFNNLLDVELDRLETTRGITVFRPDFFGLCYDIRDDPASYGFTNLTGQGRFAPNPDEYFFWDTGHPTTAAQRVLADAAIATIRPELAWDEAGPGNWSDPRWTSDAPLESPNERALALIRTDTVTVAADRTARALTIESGTIDILAGASLAVGETVEIAEGALLSVAGALDADWLTTAGTLTVAQGAAVSVGGRLAVAAGAHLDSHGTLNATVLESAGTTTLGEDSLGSIETLHVTDGTATIPALSISTINATGGVVNMTTNATDLNVDGATVNTTNVRADHVELLSGAVNVQQGSLDVATMYLSGGLLDTGSSQVVVSERLEIGELATFTVAGAPIRVSGPNLADPAEPDNLTLSGGTLTIGGGTVAPPGAIAVWKFQEQTGPTVADLSAAGNDHPGTLNGAEWFPDDPDHGTALEFVDGSYVQIAETDDIHLGSPFTIAMWIKTSEKGRTLLGKGQGDHVTHRSEKDLYIDATGGQLTLVRKSLFSASKMTGTRNVADDRWHHVAVTYNGSQADQEIYVDGENDNPTGGYGSTQDGGPVVRLGWAETRYGDGHYSGYVGLMDEVYLYDRSLSAAEVADLYESFGTVVEPLPNTNLRVTANSTLRLETTLDEATLGNLTLDPGVNLEVTGATVGFNHVTAGDGASIEGKLRAGGILSPGDSPGVLSVIGELTMDSTSTYVWELGTLAADLVAVTGGLALSAEGWTLKLIDDGAVAREENWTLFTYGRLEGDSLGNCTIDRSEVAHWVFAHDGPSLRNDIDNHRIVLTGVTAVPEPSPLIL